MAGIPHRLRVTALARALAATFLTVAGVVAAASAPHVPAALAAAGDYPEDPLSATMLDVAVIDPPGNAPPQLLVVEPDDATSGSIKVGLFHRVGDAWQIATGTVVHVDTASQPVLSAWLVDLGQGRFALLSPATAGSSTDIVIVRVGASEASDLDVGEPDHVGFAVTDAGAADVDGDGNNELIIATSSGETCSATTITVYPDRLEQEIPLTWTLQNRRLAGAAIGEFDGRKGADLLAHTYDNCEVSDLGELHHLTAIRLADGETFADLASPDVEQSREPLGDPFVVDVDGDGRDEAIVRTGADLAVIDPSQGWVTTTIGVGDAIPMAVLGAPTRLVWVSSRDSLRPAGIATIERRRTRIDVPPDVGYPAVDAVRGRLGDAYDRASVHAGFALPPPAAVLDLDADGCPEIVLPFVIAPCRGLGALEPGPAWLATAPLAGYDTEAGPTLLVALGVDWRSGGGNPVDPSPAARRGPGAWRHGASARFTLAEIPSRAVLTRPSTSPPAIDGTVAPNGSVSIGASPGARVLVQVRPIGTAEAIVDDPAPLPADFLAGPTDGSGTTFMIPPIDVRPDGSSPNGATASFDIRSLPSSDGSRLDRWLVDVAELDSVGDIAGPVRVAAVFDDSAPPLALEAPLFSPTWPLNATLHGLSEAGARIRVGGGARVVADADGAFAIDTPLAPWLQTLDLSATDGYGNSTTASISVIGGVDVRQLPWVPIVSVTFLVAALLTSLRGVGRGKRGVAAGRLMDDQPLPEIEELSTTGFRRRD